MNAIKKEDLNGFFHVQIPRVVWEMFINKEITQSTFKVYVELFDRLKVSAYYGWIDKEGDVYLKFSYPELMNMLKVKSKGTISTALDELEKLGLIIKKRGFSTSTKFYLTNVLQKSKKSDFCEKEPSEVQKKEPQKSKKLDSQKSKKLDPNNNNFNYNNLIIKTTPSLFAISTVSDFLPPNFFERKLYPLFIRLAAFPILLKIPLVCGSVSVYTNPFSKV